LSGVLRVRDEEHRSLLPGPLSQPNEQPGRGRLRLEELSKVAELPGDLGLNDRMGHHPCLARGIEVNVDAIDHKAVCGFVRSSGCPGGLLCLAAFERAQSVSNRSRGISCARLLVYPRSIVVSRNKRHASTQLRAHLLFAHLVAE